MVPTYLKTHKTKTARFAKWAGGKGGYAKKIVEMVPSGSRYLEPYAGMANVFLHLDKTYDIVALNDINSDIINAFRVVQDDAKYVELENMLTWTPYSFDEFKKALRIVKDDNASDVQKAWAFFTAQNQGFSGISKHPGNWGRTIDPKVTPEPDVWQRKVANLSWWHEKLCNVYLDNRDALDFIEYWDVDEESVFYLDPPYIQDTRVSKNVYKHETSDNHHSLLVQKLLTIKGKAVLSGYEHDIYLPLLDNGWRIERFAAHASMAAKGRGSSVRGGNIPKRVEAVYIKEK